MIRQKFKSDVSNDIIDISYFKKSHKCNLDVTMIDDISQHVTLLNTTITCLKDLGIQWICIMVGSSEPIIPENTLFFKHDKLNRICCHIEGFETFYFKNLMYIAKQKNIYIDTKNVQQNGWTVVGKNSKKKIYKDKLNSIKKDIDKIII